MHDRFILILCKNMNSCLNMWMFKRFFIFILFYIRSHNEYFDWDDRQTDGLAP